MPQATVIHGLWPNCFARFESFSSERYNEVVFEKLLTEKFRDGRALAKPHRAIETVGECHLGVNAQCMVDGGRVFERRDRAVGRMRSLGVTPITELFGQIR